MGGYNNRGNRAAAKLTSEMVDDIREEWSRKGELQRCAREAKAQARKFEREAKRLRAMAKDASDTALTISRQGLADKHGVAICTIQSITSEKSWY